MAASEAITGLTSKFEYLVTAPSTWAELGEAVSITPPQPTRENVDVTHLRSDGGYREFRGTLRDPGQAEVQFNYTPAAYDLAISLFQAEDLTTFRVTFPDTSTDQFTAYVSGHPMSPIEVDGVLRFTMNLQCSGANTFTGA